MGAALDRAWEQAKADWSGQGKSTAKARVARWAMDSAAVMEVGLAAATAEGWGQRMASQTVIASAGASEY